MLPPYLGLPLQQALLQLGDCGSKPVAQITVHRQVQRASCGGRSSNSTGKAVVHQLSDVCQESQIHVG